MGRLTNSNASISINAMILHYEWMLEKGLIEEGGSAYARMMELKGRYKKGKRHFEKTKKEKGAKNEK